MGDFYLDDLQVGQVFLSEALTLDADMIRTFAAEYEPAAFSPG